MAGVTYVWITSERDEQMGLNDTLLRSATTMNQKRQRIRDAKVHFKPKKQETRVSAGHLYSVL